MIIEYKNGLMIVTHGSGLITKYDKTDLLQIRENKQNMQNDIGFDIAELNIAITQIESSEGS